MPQESSSSVKQLLEYLNQQCALYDLYVHLGPIPALISRTQFPCERSMQREQRSIID